MSFSSSINLSSLNGSTGFRLDGVSASDASGSSVASAGDVNGDGFADLIIGASGAKPNSNNFSGSSYVAFGKASVFKYISDDYPANIGTVSGIVGLAGGLGGFVLPIMFGVLMDLTGIRSSAFMLMYGVVWVSLIWMYWTEVRKTEVMGGNAKAFSLQG